jgi:hypothetical protein
MKREDRPNVSVPLTEVGLLDELIDFECFLRNILDNPELTDNEIVKLIREKL